MVKLLSLMAAPEPTKYRIVVRGIKPERSLDEVVQALSHMSMKPPATLRQLLDGRRVVVKRTFEVQKAAKYKRALDKIGCVCTVEADVPAPVPDAGSPALTVNFTSTVDANAHASGPAREFHFAKDPRALLTRIWHRLPAAGWLAATVFLAVLYLGYERFLKV